MTVGILFSKFHGCRLLILGNFDQRIDGLGNLQFAARIPSGLDRLRPASDIVADRIADCGAEITEAEPRANRVLSASARAKGRDF